MDKQRTYQSFFQDFTSLITGGAQGIGWQLAEELAQYGSKVYLCDQSKDNLKTAHEKSIRSSLSKSIFPSYCDVSSQKQVHDWIQSIYQKTGKIDILINNAAYVKWKHFDQMSVEEEELTMKVGYNALVYTTKIVVPMMKKQKRGYIVNLGSSVGSLIAPGSSAAYSATKAAINSYTLTLQQEFKNSPIKFILIRPGIVKGTDFFKKHVSSKKIPRMGDFTTVLTPQRVAQSIIHGILKDKKIVDLPYYLKFFYSLSALVPGWFYYLLTLGGAHSKKDFSKM